MSSLDLISNQLSVILERAKKEEYERGYTDALAAISLAAKAQKGVKREKRPQRKGGLLAAANTLVQERPGLRIPELCDILNPAHPLTKRNSVSSAFYNLRQTGKIQIVEGRCYPVRMLANGEAAG